MIVKIKVEFMKLDLVLMQQILVRCGTNVKQELGTHIRFYKYESENVNLAKYPLDKESIRK